MSVFFLHPYLSIFLSIFLLVLYFNETNILFEHFLFSFYTFTTDVSLSHYFGTGLNELQFSVFLFQTSIHVMSKQHILCSMILFNVLNSLMI